MPGPVVVLRLLEARAFEDVLADVHPWLDAFCTAVTAEADGLSFHVRDGTALGPRTPDTTGTGPFLLEDDGCAAAEGEDWSALSPLPVPSVSASGLVLGAFCSGPVNHALLGRLALALAPRLDALVDFDGVLGCAAPGQGAADGTGLAEARALVPSLPGRIAEVSYGTGADGRRYRHIGDADFLAAWLDHPAFCLVT
ncbi:DUF6368 family protein [Streptacidiphilus sp. ASG 303]|uniref:DUF6368 family protein n=1 Tax=Streptacidiphilus sp. ASG 303 TaxID=2896847 RepID=UPI001E53B9CC|nr:DUF6368 family protein [Streptacidiphilus sp. ASG 303]MCD0486290.1 DUF6368 family protein [Streptacidiphilus sp. ASG 303]